MSTFIQHTSCPKCGSNDNLAEYDDHFFCFGCKYTKQKNDLNTLRKKLNKKVEPELLDTSINSSDEIPREAMQWLFKYGITPNEIKDFNIGYNKEHELLVLIKTPDFWQARCFGDTKMKYMSRGKKPLTYYGYSSKLVFVEDVLSAIKISRLSPEWCASPLLGCSMPQETIQRVLGRFMSVVIWLDRDKAKEALKIARMLRSRGIHQASVVVSPLDPKEYSKGEIEEWLKNKS